MGREITLIFFFGMLVLIGSLLASQVAAPPPQPPGGPGGADYPHARVRQSSFGNGSELYWLFEPADPVPADAPVILFLHGWGALDPEPYRRWIDHLVRRGNVVIYPKYQEGLNTEPQTMTEAALAAAVDAWRRLQGEPPSAPSTGAGAPPGHVRPRGERMIIVGHSLGAVIGANLAGRVATGEAPLPAIPALMLIEPGDSQGRYAGRDYPSILETSRYQALPSDTLLLMVVGDRPERLVTGTIGRMWPALEHLPVDNRDFIVVQSDDHGRPALVADHFSPCAAGPGFPALLDAALGNLETDALDYYGYWKLLDGLIGAVYYGRDREYALGNTEKQRFMGKWSDGTPVRPLLVSDRPLI